MKTPHSSPSLSQDEIDIVTDIIKRGEIAVGPEIEAFERKIAEYIGVKYAVAVVNGTAAVHMALRTLGVTQGDEVILPASVCPGVMHAVEYVDALPILCDTNRNDLNLNFESAKKSVTNKTKAIILPHLFGIPSDMDAFETLNIPLIEDCAQSLGSTIKGKRLGSFGTLSTFSFYATKTMTSVDGGMILTNSKKYADHMRDLRYYGGKTTYDLRYNYKLQNLNAAVGLVQFSKLQSFLKERKRQFDILFDGLKSIDGLKVLTQPVEDSNNFYYKFLINFTSEETKHAYLQSCDNLEIVTSKSIFVDLDSFYKKNNEVELENLKSHLENTYSFPIYPGLNAGDISDFIALFKKNILQKGIKG